MMLTGLCRIQPRQKKALLCLCFVVLLTIYMLVRYEDYEVMSFRHTGNSLPCVLPQLDPFDRRMMEFIWNPGQLKCDDPPIIYIDSNNQLQYNLTAIKLLKESVDDIDCDITYFNRFQDDGVDFLTPFKWKPSVNLSRDFFKAKCVGSRGLLYDSLITRVEKINNKPFQKLSEAIQEDKYNLILFGIDSVSRSTAVRQLPKLFKYLTNTLQGYDFKGYMKVADNTFVNIIPLLTGRFAFTDEIKIKDYNGGWMDSLPLIWKNFSERNCATLFAEDYPNLGMFNMDKNGFYFLPTDHYMRHFWKAKKKIVRQAFLKTTWEVARESKNVSFDQSSGLCTANMPNHVTVMNYIKQFLRTYKDERKFSFSFLTELAHDYQNILQLGDDDLTNFMKSLSADGFLNNSILVVFSDHGLRFGNVQHLYVGRMENRMPFMTIVLPDILKQKYPNVDTALRKNQERLATPFDLHATIRDILHGNYKKPGRFNMKGKTRGISLFQELPADRSCADASVSEEYCACHKTVKLNVTNNQLADIIAEATVSHLNSILKKDNKCAQLKLHKIIELNKIEQGLKHAGTARSRFFWLTRTETEVEEREDTRHSVVIETLPGEGRFYATCDIKNKNVQVIGNVDRVNKYGNQSSCVHLHELKHICYCK